MPNSEKNVEEGDVITYYELLDIYGDNSDITLKKLTVKCKNCGHVDTVMGMRKKKNLKKDNNDSLPDMPDIKRPKKFPKWKKRLEITCDTEGNKIKSSNNLNKKYISKQNAKDWAKCMKKAIKNSNVSVSKSTKTSSTSNKDSLSKTKFEEELYCPNCGSTAITLTQESLKKITADAL